MLSTRRAASQSIHGDCSLTNILNKCCLEKNTVIWSNFLEVFKCQKFLTYIQDFVLFLLCFAKLTVKEAETSGIPVRDALVGFCSFSLSIKSASGIV